MADSDICPNVASVARIIRNIGSYFPEAISGPAMQKYVMAALPRGEVLPDRSTTRPIISIFASGGFVATQRNAAFRIRFVRQRSPQSLMIPRRTAIAMASVRSFAPIFSRMRLRCTFGG